MSSPLSPYPKKTILHLTNSEYGQAQVHLAVAYALSHSSSPFSIHIASFPALRPRLSDFGTTLSSLGPNGPLHFHTLPGPSMSTTFFAPSNVPLTMIPPGTHGVRHALAAGRQLHTLGAAPSGPEWMVLVEGALDVIKEVKPNLVLMDPLFYPGIDACKLLGQRFIELVPIAVGPCIAFNQPWGRGWWKFAA